MKTISTDELKGIQLDIMDAIHAFCIENNIKYSLSCGTLIGAVRHKGFIPWDDDIDIYMLRSDFERFEQLFPEKYKNKYVLDSLNRNSKCDRPFGKVYDSTTILKENSTSKDVIGVAIDVFPIDNSPEDTELWSKYEKKRRFLLNVYMLKAMTFNKDRGLLKNMFLAFTKLILLPVSLRRIAKYMNQYAQKFNSVESKYVFESCFGIFLKKRINKCVFNDYSLIDFEDRKYFIFKNYDEPLRKAYGDYMQLPPIEKRVTHHDFEVYWKE